MKLLDMQVFWNAMDYEDLKDGLIRKSCPLLNSSYHVSVSQERHTEKSESI
jgi:hypothetical protein